jgi:translation elongation factor EF-Tu-like GTPase
VIRASLRLLASSEGGRSSPVESGYRSLARFEGSTTDIGFELHLDNGRLAPGESGTGELSFWAIEELPELAVGHSFDLREGEQVVGQGVILGPEA